jgi:DnaK suppressor protein
MKKNTKKVAALSEKKLTTTEIEGYKHKLLILHARLSDDVSTMTNAALNKNRLEASGDLSVMPIHMADVGSDNFEQEQTLSFMQNESGILDQVEEALVRIKEGTYGICESCGGHIPKVRLNFLPYATLCVQCAENTAQDEK